MKDTDMTPDGPQPDPDRLDRVLAAALGRPGLPPDFHAALMARIGREQTRDLEQQRQALALEHARRLQDLRSGYLRLRHDTLLTVVAAAFTCGAAATVALPALAQWTGTDMVTIGAWLGGALALAAAVAAVRQRTRLLD